MILKKTFILIFFLLFAAPAVFAGTDELWREVTQSELQIKTPQVEPDADAEAIFWETHIDDSSDSNLARFNYVRVKIFTERGREKYSKFDIPFTQGMKIKDVAARVIRADGSIIEIGKQDIFEREILKANKIKIRAKSFAVPNIEPGVIVEYQYREMIEDAGAKGMALEFQMDIPVQTLSYYYKPYNKKVPIYHAYNFTDTEFIKDDKGYYLAQRKNIPALKTEPQMPPSDTIRPWMLLTGASPNVISNIGTSTSYTVKDPGIYWVGFGLKNSSMAKFMNKPDKEIKRAAAEVTASASTPEEKLQKLYEFCQTQIKNQDFDPSLSDDRKEKLPKNQSVSDVLRNKIANSQFVDMLFGAMANSLGYETRIAFSANRNKMFFDPAMANDAFTHPAAIAVRINDDWKFYNPGLSFLPTEMLIWYEEDVYALLVREKGFSWVKTPLSKFDKNTSQRTGRFSLLEDGTLEGTVKLEFMGQTALDFKLNNYDRSANQREENIRNEIKSKISTAEISDLQIANVTDPAKPFTYQYKIRIPNYAQKTGKRLFLQPGFFEYGEKPLFSTADRKFDIYFHYPWEENDDIEINLPKGFSLDNADAPGEIADQDKIGYLKITMAVTKDASTLVYRRNFHFGGGNMTLFPVSSYPALKKMFDEFNKADSHMITLRQ